MTKITLVMMIISYYICCRTKPAPSRAHKRWIISMQPYFSLISTYLILKLAAAATLQTSPLQIFVLQEEKLCLLGFSRHLSIARLVWGRESSRWSRPAPLLGPDTDYCKLQSDETPARHDEVSARHLHREKSVCASLLSCSAACGQSCLTCTLRRTRT